MTTAPRPSLARRLRLAASLLVIVLMCFLVVGVVGARSAPGSVEPSAATSRFLNAYSSGDEALADSLASPLYVAEWRRLGLAASERAAIRGTGVPGRRASLHFEYFGGMRTDRGFQHLLYGVWSTEPRPAERVVYSIWRVDVDPEGRVIWLELSYLLGEDAVGLKLVDDPDDLDAAAARAGLGTLGDRSAVGVAALDGREGHYMVGLGGTTATPAKVMTFTLDSDGVLRPGSWCYGINRGPSVYPPTPAKSIEVAPSDQPLLASYLRSIG